MKRVLIAVLGLVVANAPAAFAGAVIDNGSGVRLGVNDQGHLNFTTSSAPSNASAWGVAFDFGGGDFRDATAPACLCEGWGVAVNGGNAGHANNNFGAPVNLSVDSFASTASTATSVVHLTSLPGVTVSHEYAPSTSAALFQATVTITNNTGAQADFLYRRVMDWDVPPTEFDEFVTIAGWPAANLVASTNDGFDSPNPLVPSVGITAPGCVDNGNFTKCGIADHGALFDFAFNDIADGASVTFSIFYGAAFGESAILSALGTVGAEVYSLGYSNQDGAVNTNGVVYAFGFADVGGTPVDPVPEPGTMLLLGTGLSALAVRRRRKA
jgi:PEP-CTERM motif